MGLWETMRARTQPKRNNLDALFLVPSAAITLQTALGFEPTGSGSVCYRSAAGRGLRPDPGRRGGPDPRRRRGARGRASPRTTSASPGWWSPATRTTCRGCAPTSTPSTPRSSSTASSPGCSARWCPFANAVGPALRADLPLQAGHVLPLRAHGRAVPRHPAGAVRARPAGRASCRWSPTCSAGWPSGRLRGCERDARGSATESLAAYDVLDGPPRRELDALVELAAQVAGVPFAAVNLLSAALQHQVATTGFEGADSPMRRLDVPAGGGVRHSRSCSRTPATTCASPTTPGRPGEIADVKYYGSHPLHDARRRRRSARSASSTPSRTR